MYNTFEIKDLRSLAMASVTPDDDLPTKHAAVLEVLRALYDSQADTTDDRGWVRPVKLAERLRGVASIQELVLWGHSRECYGILRELMHRGLVERREYQVTALRGRERKRKTTSIVVEYRYVQPVAWPAIFMPAVKPVTGARRVSPLGACRVVTRFEQLILTFWGRFTAYISTARRIFL